MPPTQQLLIKFTIIDCMEEAVSAPDPIASHMHSKNHNDQILTT